MGRPRKDRPRKTGETTKQQIVWDYLLANGPKTQKEIVESQGWGMYSAKDIIAKLKVKGCVRHVGTMTWGRYEAMGERPIDLRGFAVNSAIALDRLNKEAKQQKQPVTPKHLVHTSSFAQCVAWICPASRVDNPAIGLDNEAPKSRPEIAEASR